MPSRADQPISGKKLGDAEQVTADALALETDLAELAAQYEQYFLGIERRPPTKKHEAFKRDLQQLKATVVRQVAAKFRVQSLTNKVLTLERLWDRTIKEIEAGTYKRDVVRAKRHEAERAARAKPKGAAAEEVEELDLDDLDIDEEPAASAEPAAAPAAPAVIPLTTPAKPVTGVAPAVPAVAAKPPAATAPPRASPAAPPGLSAAKPPAPAKPPSPATPAATTSAGTPGGLSDQKIRAIYDAYLTAKKRCGEDTSSLNYASVADTLRKQVPALMKQHNAKSVEFKVVIKDGKAVLRALPKE